MATPSRKPSYITGRDAACATLIALSVTTAVLVAVVLVTEGGDIFKESATGNGRNATSLLGKSRFDTGITFLGVSSSSSPQGPECMERSVSQCQAFGPVPVKIFRIYAEATYSSMHCARYPYDCKNVQRRNCPLPPPPEGGEEWRPLVLYKSVCYFACPPGCKHASFCNCEPCPPGDTGRTTYSGKGCAEVFVRPGSPAVDAYCDNDHVTCVDKISLTSTSTDAHAELLT
mmetsp:Transcript_8139/g.23975  ORF Transcript_8139/g.23975 Transcript_8139/m.23975 type:complete len:230 (+) Transcript_8139:39-728(+)